MRILAIAAVFLASLGAHDRGAAPPTAMRWSAGPPVVCLRVVADRESPADMWVRAGQQATVGVRGGLTVGLTPMLRGEVIDLVVVRLADESGGGEPEETAKFVMRLGDVVELDVASMHLAVQWTELRQPATASDGLSPAGPCITCCVECDGRLKCACQVTTECGSCCCPNYCGCGSSAASRTQSPPIPPGSCGPAAQLPPR